MCGLDLKGFIVLKKLALISFGFGLSLTGAAEAQEHNFPAMNAVGRFFGVGWSRGYQAGNYDGRFEAVKDRHPASMYASNGLLYPYHTGYQPQSAFQHMGAQPGFAQPVYGDSAGSHALGSGKPHGVNPIVPGPVEPPKPVVPPPTWLRPYLKDEANSGINKPQTLESEKREEVQADEVSPSDLIQPKVDEIKPKMEGNPEASDDDDLLTLTPPQNPIQRYNEARGRQESKR